MQNNNIVFDDNKYKSRAIFGQSETSRMARFLVKKGLVKNEKQASILMILIVILAMSATVFIIYVNFFKQPTVPPVDAEQELLINPRRAQ